MKGKFKRQFDSVRMRTLKIVVWFTMIDTLSPQKTFGRVYSYDINRTWCTLFIIYKIFFFVFSLFALYKIAIFFFLLIFVLFWVVSFFAIVVVVFLYHFRISCWSQRFCPHINYSIPHLSSFTQFGEKLQFQRIFINKIGAIFMRFLVDINLYILYYKRSKHRIAQLSRHLAAVDKAPDSWIPKASTEHFSLCHFWNQRIILEFPAGKPSYWINEMAAFI